MRVDLITGFLGAGKTTFLKKYAAYLKKKGNALISVSLKKKMRRNDDPAG